MRVRHGMKVALCAGLLGAVISAGAKAAEVPSVVYDNPVAGFSITIPEDWDMGTGVLGDTTITLNPRTPSGAAPSFSFFYMQDKPEQGARNIAQFLTAVGPALGVSITPQVRATGKPNEWEVTASAEFPYVGEVNGRWLCRLEKNTTYVIGVLATTQAASDYRDEMETAFNTCHLMDRPLVHYFREPTENGYRLVIPEGWQWEGSIFRDVNVPGWFVFKVQSPEKLTGCFESQPVTFMANYIDAQTLAGGALLDSLRNQVGDIELESFHPLPRAGKDLAIAIAIATGGNTKIQAETAFADYIGTQDGTRVRIRVDISSYYLPLMFGGGSETVSFRGAWAPIDKFDELFPIARGVDASLWETPEWRRNIRATVAAVLKGRAGAMGEAAEDWDRYLREVEMVKDPQTGDAQEVPYGPGQVWKDQDGKMFRVPESQTLLSELDRRGWKKVQ